MKTFKKILVLGLSVSMLISLAGCNKKTIDADKETIDADKFEDVMDDLEYNVTVEDDEDYLDNGQKEAGYAYDDDYNYIAAYVKYEDKSDAVEEYEDLVDDVKDAKKDDEFDGEITVSGFGNGNQVIVNGEFDDSDDYGDETLYMVVYRIDDTIVTVMAYDNDKKDIKEVDKILKELGY